MIIEHGKAIVEHLQERFAPMQIERNPSSPHHYTLKSQHGAILVAYAGREYDDPERPHVFGVKEIRWSLAIIKKNLRRTGAQDGIEELLDELAGAFTGFRLGDYIYYPRDDAFDDFDESDGTWTYTMLLVGYSVAELEGLS